MRGTSNAEVERRRRERQFGGEQETAEDIGIVRQILEERLRWLTVDDVSIITGLASDDVRRALNLLARRGAVVVEHRRLDRIERSVTICRCKGRYE